MKKIQLITVESVLAVLCVAMTADAQTFTTLMEFNGTNGYNANALSQASNGNLVGTTLYGGTGAGGTDGTVFEITPFGKMATIYNFCSQGNLPCADGVWPNGPLLLASNGNYYGTTQVGGPTNYGTVFKITPAGRLSFIYNFCSLTNCADGAVPIGPLVEGRNGNLYGITEEGGTPLKAYCPFSACGTVFEITPNGKLTTLHSFCSTHNCADGIGTGATLMLGTDGNIYGTTETYYAYSTLFRVRGDGKFSTLLALCSETNCSVAIPSALVEGSDGNLYGTDAGLGAFKSGAVFKISQAGEVSTLYSFCSQSKCADGYRPYGGLIQGSDGNFYGTTTGGGTPGCVFNGCGTIFRVTPAGALTTLYDFCSLEACTDGAEPTAGLVQRTDGTFYGTTEIGGDSSCNFPTGCGTVFSFSTGLGPFATSNPGFGKVGRTVGILGNGLTGTTSVAFNGVTATFTVLSDTFIKATVPSGATTGTIQVTTPTGTLSSNVAFQVLP